MTKKDYTSADIDHLVEIQGHWDAWSIAVLKDGRVINRWAGLEGYEERARITQEYIDRWFTAEPDVALFDIEDEEE